MSTIVLCLGVAGCVDAKGSFDDFSARIVDGNTSQPDRPNFTTIPDVTGEFLLAARPNLPEDRILEFIADFTMTANADGTATLTWTTTALTTADHTPSNQASPMTATDIQVRLDGTFDAPMQGVLPGDANPVIPGTSANLDAIVHGEIDSEDFVCGTLTGTAGSLTLDGSTFAAQRITPGTTDGSLPDAIFKCPDGTAGDAGVDAM
jgi:hypothetical protein